jgi:AbrB family looped-hinge helix DNA binding protein
MESDTPRTKSGCIPNCATSDASASAGGALADSAASRMYGSNVASLDELRKSPGRLDGVDHRPRAVGGGVAHRPTFPAATSTRHISIGRTSTPQPRSGRQYWDGSGEGPDLPAGYQVEADVRRVRLTHMAHRGNVVRLSSKGQLVIPASLRRRLGLKTGQALAVRTGNRREIVLSPAEEDSLGLEAMLDRARAWSGARRRDLVAELHDRRRRERAREGGGR